MYIQCVGISHMKIILERVNSQNFDLLNASYSPTYFKTWLDSINSSEVPVQLLKGKMYLSTF